MKTLFVTGMMALVLTGCGADLCVGNMGDCDRINRSGTGSATSGGTLTLIGPAERVKVGARVKLQARGGSPPYKFFLIDTPSSCGGDAILDQATGELFAPKQPCTVTVKVIDSTMTPKSN